MNVTEFEQKVWEVDRLRVIVRAPNNATVQDFTQRNAAGQGQRLTEYLEVRIYPRVAPYEVTIVRGDGSLPHRGTSVGNVRQSYIR
jgi:hypothetical protein